MCSNSDIYFFRKIHISRSFTSKQKQPKINTLKWISTGNLWIITVKWTFYCGWFHGESWTKVLPYARGLSARWAAEELVIDLRANNPRINTHQLWFLNTDVKQNIMLLLISIGLLLLLIMFSCIASVWFNALAPMTPLGVITRTKVVLFTLYQRTSFVMHLG